MAGVRVLLDVVLDAEVGPCLQDQPVAGGRVADVGWSLKDWFSRWAKESSALMLTESDLKHLRRCVDLATAALEAGDEPFGSVLVAADGAVLAEDHNRVAAGDRTQHPEFALARWAAANLAPAERAAATVYTSGEHCPMCAAAQDGSASAASSTPAHPPSWRAGSPNSGCTHPRCERCPSARSFPTRR